MYKEFCNFSKLQTKQETDSLEKTGTTEPGSTAASKNGTVAGSAAQSAAASKSPSTTEPGKGSESQAQVLAGEGPASQAQVLAGQGSESQAQGLAGQGPASQAQVLAGQGSQSQAQGLAGNGSESQSQGLVGSVAQSQPGLTSNSPSQMGNAGVGQGGLDPSKTPSGFIGSSKPSAMQNNQGLPNQGSNSQSLANQGAKTHAGEPCTPCIPTTCVEMELLAEIAKLKEDKIRLETKLEMYMGVGGNTTFQSQQPSRVTDCNEGVPIQGSKTHPAVNVNCLNCQPTSPNQTQLLDKIHQLQQERLELERRLVESAADQNQCQYDQNEMEEQIQQTTNCIAKLQRDKQELERKIVEREACLSQRNTQLEEFVQRVGAERCNLQMEIKKAAKELQDEIQKRKLLQVKFNNTLQVLEEQKQQDLQILAENERLKNDLEMLNSRVQSFAVSLGVCVIRQTNARPG